MAKTHYVCQNCAAELGKWAGQCPECGAWNSISEQQQPLPARATSASSALDVTPITAVQNGQREQRYSTHIEELDRVLGGGLVTGSAVLMGGSPGIGKSTLLLQAAAKLAAHSGNTLYITGEESAEQVALRGQRIKASDQQLQLLACCELEAMIATIARQKPCAVIMDSIQTTVSNRLSSAPGTVSQVRDCASALIQQAKQLGHALILVGHVTKDGALAGPRVLEHMVDAVLYFEGDRGHAHRIVRAVKNRFGPAGEIGVFEMSDRGLHGIRDASRLFLAERHADTSGSVVLACIEGTRPLLVEVQALVAKTVYATPKRSAVGVDVNRVSMLTAVLERRIGIPLAAHDVYINVAGGAKIIEPAADLAILLAVLSAFYDRPLPVDGAVFGEVGLTGELRAVAQPEARVKEMQQLNFRRVLLPQANVQRLQESSLVTPGLHVQAARSLAEMARLAFTTAS